MNLLDNFQRYIRRNELAAPEDFILLTVSGGVDSMVMLSLFVRSGYRVGVAHCNFQLRGVESEEDEELVRREAEKYGVPWYNKRFDTKGEMERTGESMEMAARRLRYAWFDELSREHGYTVVAIAHHIDDSIETFFINLLRGTGLRGLTGITTHAGKLIRPLMFASRKDILEYAVANRIPFREDSSNRSTKYLRNKIRLGLVPRIREINPKFTDLMRRNIDRLSDAQRFIDALQRAGCTLCLDDFGTGFASFAYLKHLQARVLKIDGLFVRNLPREHDNQVFVRSIIEVAHGMGKLAVAEFVEDEQTLQLLQGMGVDMVQGYHLDKPRADHPGLHGDGRAGIAPA